jgi:5-methylcytosine-specific restriction endonuclease McrA
MGIIHSRHQWVKLRREFKEHCRRTNARCRWCIARGDIELAAIDYTAVRSPYSFEADHIRPVDSYPHLAFEWSNLAPSHARCNRQKGAKDAATPHVWVRPDW